jgi:hypothetical protein
MEKQNITLSIPKNILQKVKLLALKRGTTVSSLLTQTLEEIVQAGGNHPGEETYDSGRHRHLATLEAAENLGT